MTDSKRMLLPTPIQASLLSGATQVSVPVKPQPVLVTNSRLSLTGEWYTWVGKYGYTHCELLHRLPVVMVRDCPFPVGTEVWVPETWRIGAWDENSGRVALDYSDGFCRREWLDVPYVPDGSDRFNELWEQSTDDAEAAGMTIDEEDEEYHWEPGQSPCRWRPAITMPSDFARLRCIIEGVKAGRVQDVTYEDAVRAGYVARTGGPIQDWYISRWNAAYPDYPWSSNPWRYTYTMRRL